MIKSFADLKEKTSGKLKQSTPVKAAVIYPDNQLVINTVLDAERQGYIAPVFVGGKISDRKNTVEIAMRENAMKMAMEKVTAGEIDMIIGGNYCSPEFINGLLKPENGFVIKGQILSHVGIIQTEKYDKLMLITDALINSNSDANIKIAVTQNAARLAQILGNSSPKAALLAAVEAIYPAVPVTMEEAAIAKMSDRGQIKGVDIDGPLSLDVAINKEVALSKGITSSRVAGEADIFTAPSRAAADGLYKAMVMYAKAEAAGIIMGGRIPAVVPLTLDKPETILNSVILGVYVVLTQKHV